MLPLGLAMPQQWVISSISKPRCTSNLANTHIAASATTSLTATTAATPAQTKPGSRVRVRKFAHTTTRTLATKPFSNAQAARGAAMATVAGIAAPRAERIISP